MNWLDSFFGRVPLSSCEKAPNVVEPQQAAASSQQRKNAAKVGFIERRRQEKAEYETQMNREQSQLLARHLPQLTDMLKESNKALSEQKTEHSKLRKAYDEHATLRKYRHNVKKRLEQASQNTVAVELNKFARELLFRKTDDEVVYQYQRKLQRIMQWQMLCKQWLPIGLGLIFFKLTRRLKKATPTDILYFMVPYCYANYGIFCVEQRTIFETGYPAHPYIIEQRMGTINRSCFSYPQIIKNEIEYLHTKLSEEHKRRSEQEASTDVKGGDDGDVALRFERVFTLGEVSSDYKKLLQKQTKKDEKNEEEAKKKLKFKVIVEDGELFLQCIDPFEEIFEISRKSIEDLELTELLDPFMFDNHREIINALFEVYYTVSQDYLEVFYHAKAREQGNEHSSSLADRAVQKLRQQYRLDGLDDDTGDTDRNIGKTIIDAEKKI